MKGEGGVDDNNVIACTTMSRTELLEVALNMGEVLLKSGAETSRVEDTLTRFCRTCGYHEMTVFVTPTLILIGDKTSPNSTMMCRVHARSTNLSNISELNEFSYSISREPISYSEAMSKLKDFQSRRPPYGKWSICLASAICSATFAGMLGGNSHDFMAAFITGGLAMVLLKHLGGFRPSAFWENALAGAAIGALTIFCCAMSVQCTKTNIIVGSLMPFVPGVACTNGLRDYMAGDLVSGNSRIAEALLFAISIAIGLAFSLLIWYHWGWDLWVDK